MVKIRGASKPGVLIFVLLSFLLFSTVCPFVSGQRKTVIVYFFWIRGCSHCHEALRYLELLQGEYPELEVRSFEVGDNEHNRALFIQMSDAYGVSYRGGLPAFFAGDDYIIGYRSDEDTGQRYRAIIESCLSGVCEDPMLRLQSTATTATETSDAHKISTSAFSETTAASSTETSETVTFETRSTPVETPHRRLFLFTATIGFLDGLNPCSIWAFCILLGLLLRLGSRKRMLLVGGTYIIFSGLVYLGFLLAWLGFNLVFSFTWILRLGIGLAVVIIGVLNVKDFATSFRGPSLQIPDSQKPRLYRMMRRLAAEKTPLPLLLVGVAFLAFTLNLVELVCTAGLPATYTQVLASQNLPMRLYYLYLLEYVFFYTIDLLFLLLVFTITLTAFKVGETYGRVSKLVSGLVMLGLGLILILRPDLLAFS